MKNYKKILNNQNVSETLKSISALHIVKLHALFIIREGNFFSLILKIFKILFTKSTEFFVYLFKNNFFESKRNFPQKKILIVSHFINIKFINSKEDFYFGNLEKKLKKLGKPVLKLMINHTNYSSSFLNSKNKNKDLLILEKYLSPSIECKILLKKIFTIFELLFFLFNKKINFKNFYELLYSLFDSSTTLSLRMRYQIDHYVKKVKPNYFIFTFEGYSWERISIKTIKNFNSNINCIGYQHTPVTNNHHSIFNDLRKNYNPDKIWCSQAPSHKLLKKRIKHIKKNNIKLVGNFKKINLSKKKNMCRNIFLILPEGIYSECEKLFKFSYSVAKKNSYIKFIWRVHPVINLSLVLENLNIRIKDLPKNIKISNNTFEEDSKNSDFVIYKGSASVLKSLLMGNYPIYYKSLNEKNFDPLLKFFHKKNYFSNDSEFLDLIKKVKKTNYNEDIKRKGFLIKRNIFPKPNLKIIKSDLNSFTI